MKQLTALFFCSVITGGLYAQTGDIDSTSLRATAYTRHLYETRRNIELPLYNGLRHQLYPSSIEGNPYFLSKDWYKGTVVYDNVLYHDITMRFDQVKEELVITNDESSGIFVSLFSPRVKEFTFAGSRFVRLIHDSLGKSSLRTGIYQELVTGKLTALVRTIKEIDEKIEGTTLFRIIDEENRYYVLVDGVYHPIRNQGDLMDMVKERRKEVQQYLSKSQLKFRREPKETIIAVIQFYNQL
jgi:hypothetical protein